LGCYRTLFVGNYIFAACPSKKSTNIKVYSMEKGEKRMTLKGHREMIYSLSTTQNERYLISAGSDHTVRIWEIP
jgi:WD40 repeat protein